MYTVGLELPGGVLVRISHFHPHVGESMFRMLAGAYLPGVIFTEPPAKPNLDVTVRWSTKSGVLVTGQESYGLQVSMFDRWRADESTLDLLNLLYAGARRLWLHRGLYPVHAACVGNEKKGYILIVGHSGSGKTAITRRLAADGRLVFSGNKTLVSFGDYKITGVAGTQTLTMLARDAGGSAAGNYDVPYGLRDSLVLPAAQYASAPARITLVMLAQLNDGYDQYDLLSDSGGLHSLYPLFMDSVNADVVLCGGDEVFSGDAPSGSRERLSRSLKRTVPMYKLSGSLDYVSKFIEELV